MLLKFRVLLLFVRLRLVCNKGILGNDKDTIENLEPSQITSLTDQAIQIELIGNEEVLVVPCKTNKNLNRRQVELWSHEGPWTSAPRSHVIYEPHIGFKLTKTPWKLLEQHMFLYCVFKEGNSSDSWQAYSNPRFNAFYTVRWGRVTPNVYVGMEQMNFTCTVQVYQNPNSQVSHPQEAATIQCPRCKQVNFEQKFHSRKLVAAVDKVASDDGGIYTCQLLRKGTPTKEAAIDLQISETLGQIKLLEHSQNEITVKEGETLELSAKYQYYPNDHCNTTWIREYKKIFANLTAGDSFANVTGVIKQEVLQDDTNIDRLRIRNVKLSDSGIYVLNFQIHDLNKRLEFKVSFIDSTQISYKVNVRNDRIAVNVSVPTPTDYNYLGQKFYSSGSRIVVVCSAISLPSVEMRLEYRIPPMKDWHPVTPDEIVIGTYETVVHYEIIVKHNQEVRCSASKGRAKNTTTIKIGVTNGKPTAKLSNIVKSSTAVDGEKDKEIYEGDSVELSCVHPQNAEWDVDWAHNDQNIPPEEINTTSDGISRIVKIFLSNVTATTSKVYSCLLSKKKQPIPLILPVQFSVLKTEKPKFTKLNKDASKIELKYGLPSSLSCPIDGIPRPRYQWFKDGEPYNTGTSIADNGTLYIPRVNIEDRGVFTCKAVNRLGSEEASFTATVIGGPYNLGKWFIIGGVVLFLVALLISFLIYMICKQMKTNRDQVTALGKLYEQLMRQIPQHGINTPKGNSVPLDQRLAEFAYDRQYEIEKESLSVGQPIGAGQFGKVCIGKLTKYEGSEEHNVTVAVKQPLIGSNPDHQSMLIQELKLMSALDNHPNVIALLGAVTKFMKLGELHVVVEYCANGSLKDYILTRKGFFVNELSSQEMNKDGTIKKSQYASEAYLNYSFPNSAPHSDGETDHLLAVSDSLTTSDLLSFAMQIAKGMNHLANIPCVHRDLALRNILVTSNKILRVADFGLARSMQKEYYRQQKGKKIPLPVRWMSIEAVEHCMYTVASDVWSYGIVLYELFSLGGLPYPSFENEDLLDKLKRGYRNPKPKYVHEEIFGLMTQCCEEEVRQRPKFTRCVEVTREHLQRCNPNLLQQVEAATQKTTKQQQDLIEWVRQEVTAVARPHSIVQIPKEPANPPKKSFIEKLIGK